MKRFMEGSSVAQELSVGPAAEALFTGGSQGYASGMHGRGFGTSFSFGGEVVYSLSSVPLDLIGQPPTPPSMGEITRGTAL